MSKCPICKKKYEYSLTIKTIDGKRQCIHDRPESRGNGENYSSAIGRSNRAKYWKSR